MANNPHTAKLVPELYCSDIQASLQFYVDVLDFKVLYARPEDRFAFLDREGAQIMLEQPVGRAWLTAEMVKPYGRGINFEIEAVDVDGLAAKCDAAGCRIFLPLEEKWYRRDDRELGCRQFIVQDPDGYLLRFSKDLGDRPLAR
jgi:catechol 2,3-dioxygenase-like lactoylglutathione lyase family enzyme